MKFVDQEDFAAHVAAHLGATKLEVVRACEVVLGAFAGYLSPAERALFLRELPSSLAAQLEHANTSVALPLEEQLVALGLPVGHAREVVASVCHVLGEQLSDDVLSRLQRALPESVAAFAVRPVPGLSLTASRAARRHDTLAEGRPGSHAPVSSARAERTQQASVAADNPHGDAKLSSSPGSTQEREHETLAEGHPATHPIATSRG
ncbi:MAG: hypothetical protein H6Q90_5217 [Deltaproteobacteria bacterium]|nr:hypothetical protein [Deltaproteobacteria bacterium]